MATRTVNAKHPLPGFDRLPPDLQAMLRQSVKTYLKGEQTGASVGVAPVFSLPALRVNFGVYALDEAETLEWFARDILLAVEQVLRLAGGQEPCLEPEDLSALGNLLEWARKCQAYHGLEADHGEDEPSEEQRAEVGTGKAA